MKHQNCCKWQKVGPIGILSINNPPDNLIKEPEFVKKELLEEIMQDTTLKGMIIKGTGRHFSAGADMVKLKQFACNEALLTEKLSGGKNIIRLIENMNIPVIAAIAGVCFGAGFEIALACHIRFCSKNALFAFPETNYGIMPGLGGTVTLTKLVGAGKSTEIILMGEMVDAQKALEIKLVDYILPKKDLEVFTMNYLTKMTANRDTDVIHSVMKSIHNSQILTFEKALEEETKLFCSLAIKNMQDKI